MKAETISYWVTTGIIGLGFAGGGVGDLLRAPNMAEEMAALGYPAHLMTLLGVWKVLGAVAVVIPKAPRLKEWAYAGMVFDLTGAAVSHAAVGSTVDKVIIPLVFLALALASWWLRPESRKLPGSAPLLVARQGAIPAE